MHAPFARFRTRLSVPAALTALFLAAALALPAGCQSEQDYTSQGTEASPIDLGVPPLTYDEGTVGPDASSYYKATGITEGNTYTISLSSLEDDADLIVYSDSGFSTVFCVSAKNSTSSEVCSKLVDTGSGITELYIQVKPHTSTGTSYLLSVSVS